MKLIDCLQYNALHHGKKVAIACGHNQVTYAELYTAVCHEAELLKDDERKAVVLRASQSIAFVTTYFAAHMAGKAFVPLEHDLPEEKFSQIKQTVALSDIPTNIADILFTTGTTGKPKGTMLSHEAIIADAENLVNAHQFSNDLTFVISGPLNHIGSLSKIWPTVMVGATLCITDGMKDLDGFFKALEQPKQKTATFLVPASIRMLLQFSKARIEQLAYSIDFIETGAAAIAESDMKALRAALPHTRLYNTYASTETGIICTYDYSQNDCIAGCLGPAMKNSKVFITDEGFVACSGSTLMTGYLNDPTLTAEILRNNTIYTHDQGYIDEHGNLHLTGRADDIINIGGFKVNPVEVENAANLFPTVEDCICIPDKHPVLGTILHLLIVSKPDTTLDKKQLAQFLATKLERYKVPQRYSTTDKIARTYNGKLNRKHYQ